MMLAEEMAYDIDHIVKNIALKLKDYENVYKIVNDEKNDMEINDKKIKQFSEQSISHGIPALCALYGELSEQYPEEEWLFIGHEYMKRLGKYINDHGLSSISMFSGAAGIGLGTFCMSHNGERYKNFMGTINEFLGTVIEPYIMQLEAKQSVFMQDYDTIEGLCGTANYCLLFPKDNRMKVLSQKILKYLVNLCKDKEIEGKILPGFFITPDNYFNEAEKVTWPGGIFNLGMSHGIPGILTVLCKAGEKGIHVDLQQETIIKLSEFLMKYEHKEAHYWGTQVLLEEFEEEQLKSTYTRDAWCYGTPGVAYAILVAGKYLDRKDFVEEAVIAMKKAIDRLEGIYSPSFCHGYAGVAYISNRFYEITHLEEFKDKAVELSYRILEYYDDRNPFGFQNIESGIKGKKYYDNIGIIDGTSGILLTLLAIYKQKKTPWDSAFALQE